MYNEDEYLLISGIQHFSFCRRQWALIHLEEKWNENVLTAEGRLIHERVHDTDSGGMRNGILTLCDMPVYSPILGITGACDAVEFLPDKNGITLRNRPGSWRVRPVEYKHGVTKMNDCDRLQVTAQALCLEEMFCCTIEEGAIFYHETRRRETFAISVELRQTVISAFAEMHDYFKRGYTPKVKKHAGCAQCSLYETCLPALCSERKIKVADYIAETVGASD